LRTNRTFEIAREFVTRAIQKVRDPWLVLAKLN